MFWAVVLIGVGVVALLFTLDVMEPASLGMLTYVWPIVIIGVGVDLLFGRRSLLVGGLIGVVTVGLIVLLMAIGPGRGWTGDTELKTDTFTAPVGQATSAQVSVDTGGYSADIHALPVSSSPDRPLFDASLAYRGSIDFQSSGDTERVVSLDPKGQHWWWFLLDLAKADAWDIGLDPKTPIDLVVDSASGSVDVDLSEVDLTGLEASMSSGDMRVVLPEDGSESYEAALKVSSGDLDVQTAAGARADLSVRMSSGDVQLALGADSDVTVTFNGSSGEFTLDLAAGQALSVEVQSVSSGDVNLPQGMVQVVAGKGETGTWETSGFATATHKVRVIVEHMSSGSASIALG